jgi:hypothetical protein
MIPKGNQRGGGQQLAAHLQNTYDNDRVDIADLRGAVAPDLAGAFSEWNAQAKATNCKKYLYSLSLNPDQRQGKLTREQYFDFIARVEKRLGLEHQPRAVVFHVKYGREHCHVVWSRIDPEKMRAVQLSNDHYKLRRVAQEFAKDNGLELPEGLKKNKGDERYEDRKDSENLGEKQQEERSGFSKADRVRSITDAWNSTRTGEEFIRALAQKDYYLARGDKRGYVVVDLAGEIHSLSRQIKGAKSKQVKARLASLSPDKLPGVEKAQDYAKQMREARQRQAAPEKDKGERADTGNVPTQAERREQLRRQHAIRRRALDGERDKLTLRQAKERGELVILQATENAGVVSRRTDKQPKAVTAFLMRVTGIKLLIDLRQRAQDKDRAVEHEEQIAALQRRQDREKRESDRHYRALERVERRELRSLETSLRREEFQRVSGRGKSRPPGKAETALIPEHSERQPAAFPGQTLKAPEKKSATAAFNRAGQDTRGKSGQKPEALRETNRPEPVAGGEKKENTLREAFSRAGLIPDASPESAPTIETPRTGLAEEFRRRAENKDRQRDDLDGGDRSREKRYCPLPPNHASRR